MAVNGDCKCRFATQHARFHSAKTASKMKLFLPKVLELGLKIFSRACE